MEAAIRTCITQLLNLTDMEDGEAQPWEAVAARMDGYRAAISIS